MIRIARSIFDEDGASVGTITITFDTDGVEIIKDGPENPTFEIFLTHDECEMMYDLITLTYPAYKEGQETRQ